MPADGALANLQVDARVIVDVIDAHFVGNGEPAEGHVLRAGRVVPASRHKTVSLAKQKSPATIYITCGHTWFKVRQLR